MIESIAIAAFAVAAVALVLSLFVYREVAQITAALRELAGEPPQMKEIDDRFRTLSDI